MRSMTSFFVPYVFLAFDEVFLLPTGLWFLITLLKVCFALGDGCEVIGSSLRGTDLGRIVVGELTAG